ncbi:hypothetical protein B0H65DRAFT_442987 [Neurospora tetraspora]|uniref:Uncharacterized protein n=1 Tax=Neurospora tetraspora TaxID=94610 RepID=A0AAE0JG30_9PEZI|nr:hypothetical protein B0H65DRAFT_442987 [Neurospora tetraspora]
MNHTSQKHQNALDGIVPNKVGQEALQHQGVPVLSLDLVVTPASGDRCLYDGQQHRAESGHQPTNIQMALRSSVSAARLYLSRSSRCSSGLFSVRSQYCFLFHALFLAAMACQRSGYISFIMFLAGPSDDCVAGRYDLRAWGGYGVQGRKCGPLLDQCLPGSTSGPSSTTSSHEATSTVEHQGDPVLSLSLAAGPDSGGYCL